MTTDISPPAMPLSSPATPPGTPATPLLDAVRTGLRVIDLGRRLTVGMPQSPNHPAYWHSLPRRHGDVVRADGGSAANDMITMGTHVGTHIDALAHVSHDGRLYGGVPVEAALTGGRYADLGVHTIAPMVRRGVLLDVPATLGVDRLDAGYEITVADLTATVERQGVDVGPEDVVLLRSGWGQHFDSGDRQAFMGQEHGVPGVGEAGAYWLADHRVHAAGADTIAFERLAPGAGHALLPAHRVLLVEQGIYLIETMDLEQLAREAVHEFLFVCAPLALFGATGSPVRPLAVVTGG
ncbi:cyclase family protein [Micromonospora sp. NBC_01813]|uniref:cyclase family protein n=1 Tax=Micromonospora sp. NBC_01813 TaxID=2975988 RepID=UPI002DD79DFE|nr:cyclase family protein [Micromonospora sp. NBC_01813]WSA08948.1 cyclase family protein [Micromonospora sp. NBC_01813]